MGSIAMSYQLCAALDKLPHLKASKVASLLASQQTNILFFEAKHP